jgi:hypothetical protein
MHISSWISTSWRLLFGRSRPKDLPPSAAALMEAAILYGFTSAVDAAGVMKGLPAGLFAVADLLFVSLATSGMLLIARRPYRISQTLLAMLGTGFWLTLPSIAVHGAIGMSGATERAPPLALQLGFAGVLVWSVIVVARIFRDALDTDFRTGLAVSLAYFIAYYLVLVALPQRVFS